MAGRIWVLCSGLLIITSCFSTKENLQEKDQKQPYDAIIIPGIPFNQSWSDNIMKERVLWSWFLYSRGYAKNVIYSGSAVYTPFIEARIMALYGEALGIPRENIFCEENAEHSTENMVYGYRLAREQGFRRIALASDGFQTAMLKTFAWDLHMKIDFIPFNPDSLRKIKIPENITIDPSGARVANFVSLPEKENMFKRMLGTMGLDIQEP